MPLRNPLATAVMVVATAVLAVTVAASAQLVGLAGAEERTLRGLQIRVLAISHAAAENRMEEALAALAVLERDLDDAAGRGLLPLPRYLGIEAALRAVRADISGSIATSPAAASAAPATVSAAAEGPAPPPGPGVLPTLISPPGQEAPWALLAPSVEGALPAHITAPAAPSDAAASAIQEPPPVHPSGPADQKPVRDSKDGKDAPAAKEGKVKGKAEGAN